MNAASLNFRAKASSPTIDKGTATTDKTDVAGTPRNLGKGNDIGAYEYAPKFGLSHFTIAKRTKHSIKVNVTVSTGGFPTEVQTISTPRHRHHKRSQPEFVPAKKLTERLGLEIKHLKRHTKYHIRVSAKNTLVSSRIAKKAAKTR